MASVTFYAPTETVDSHFIVTDGGGINLHRTRELAAGLADFGEFMNSLPVTMSPAMIFMMLEKRMNSLDSQIQSSVASMEDAQEALASLQEDVQNLLAVKAGANAGGKIWGSDVLAINGVSHTVDEWFAAAGITISGTVEDDGVNDGRTWYEPAALQDAIGSIEANIRKLNQGSEMKMMELQSLMQQRSSEISLATNMLKSVQEGTDAIVRNIG